MLPVLLDRNLFPTLAKLCIQNGNPEPTIWTLGLLEKSNIHTLTLYGFRMSDGILPQLEVCLASGRVRKLTFIPGNLESLLAVSPYVLECFEFSVRLNDEEDIVNYLEPFIAVVASAEFCALTHLRADVELDHDLLGWTPRPAPGDFSSCPLWSHSLLRAMPSAGSLPTIC